MLVAWINQAGSFYKYNEHWNTEILEVIIVSEAPCGGGIPWKECEIAICD